MSTSSVLEKAISHFAKRRLDLKSVDVPEWDTVIYYKPMTFDQKRSIFEKDAHWSDIALNMLIVRALDDAGVPLFKLVHKTELRKQVDPEVIERIANEMAVNDSTPDDAKKN